MQGVMSWPYMLISLFLVKFLAEGKGIIEIQTLRLCAIPQALVKLAIMTNSVQFHECLLV